MANYLNGRSQIVHVSKCESDDMILQYVVNLQGSVLGPGIYIEYAEDVSGIFTLHILRHHLFADAVQCYHSRPPSERPAMASRVQVQRCVLLMSATASNYRVIKHRTNAFSCRRSNHAASCNASKSEEQIATSTT